MKIETLIADERTRTRNDVRGLSAPPQELETVAPVHELPATTSIAGVQLIAERGNRFHFLNADAVEYIEVDGNYVTIHIGNERFLTRTTLKHLSSLLAAHDFVRIDRSLLVNLRHVDYVERLERGQFAFKLRHGQQLMSSRARGRAIVRLLRAAAR